MESIMLHSHSVEVQKICWENQMKANIRAVHHHAPNLEYPQKWVQVSNLCEPNTTWLTQI